MEAETLVIPMSNTFPIRIKLGEWPILVEVETSVGFLVVRKRPGKKRWWWYNKPDEYLIYGSKSNTGRYAGWVTTCSWDRNEEVIRECLVGQIKKVAQELDAPSLGFDCVENLPTVDI